MGSFTRAGLLLACGLVMFLILQAVNTACESDGNDLTSYCLSSHALLQGGNPYATGSPFPYVYPLFLALIIAPLAILPCTVTTLIWALVGLAALVGTLAIIRHHAPARLPVALLLGLCLVYFDVIQNNVVNGQVNFLVLYLCVLGFQFSRKDRDAPAALAIGAAAAIKLTPLIMLCYLAARRRWLALGGTVLVFLLLCLLPGVVPGVDLGGLYGEYGREFLAAKLAGGTVRPDHVDFSLAGILIRAGLPLNTVATAVFLLLVPGAILLWDRRSLRREGATDRDRHDLRAFSLYMLAPLFVVPISEVHHLVFALPAYSCLAALARASGARSYWLLPAASLAVYLAASLVWREGPLYFVSLALLCAGVPRAR